MLDDGFVAVSSGSTLGEPSGSGSGSGDSDAGVGGSANGPAGSGGSTSVAGAGGASDSGSSEGTGSPGADAGPSGTDGSGASEGTPTPIVWDGVSDADGCRFGPPERLSGFELATGSERGPVLDPDSATLLLSSNRSGNEDLFEATRSGRGLAFSAASALSGLNTDADESTPFLAASDLAVYFNSNRSGGSGGRDLYVSTRLVSLVPFINPSRVANVNSAEDDSSPRLAPNELSLLFSSTRPGGAGGADLWLATRSSTWLNFGTPTPLAGVNSAANEDSGHLSTDRLAIVFDSTRDGGLGGHDLWLATRTGTDSAFGSPINLTGLNSGADEVSVSMSEDGQEILFSSNRADGSAYHLWRALRTCD